MAEKVPDQWLTEQVSTSAEFEFNSEGENILEDEQITRLTSSIKVLIREINLLKVDLFCFCETIAFDWKCLNLFGNEQFGVSS